MSKKEDNITRLGLQMEGENYDGVEIDMLGDSNALLNLSILGIVVLLERLEAMDQIDEVADKFKQIAYSVKKEEESVDND